MFRLDTGQARTDLYGLNKGAAQVINPSILLRKMEMNANREDAMAADKRADAAKQQKEADARKEAIYKNIALATNVAVKPNDVPMFQGMAKDLGDYVVQNIDKINSNDAEAINNVNAMIGDIKLKGEQSKNAREFAEAGLKKINDNENLYSRSSMKKIGGFLADPEYAGNWDVSNLTPSQKVDFTSRINTVLSPIVDDIKKKDPARTVFKANEAADLIKSDILANPSLIDQANDEFEIASDEKLKSLGLTRQSDPVDYMAQNYKNLLVRDEKGSPYYTGFGSQSEKAPKVVGTYTAPDGKNGKREFQFEYKDKTDNPYIAIPDPEGGGGVVEVKPYKVVFNDAKGKTMLKVLTKDGVETEVDYSGVKDIMNNKFGISNVYELESENTTPSHVQVTRVRSGKKETETKSTKSTLKVGDVKGGYKYNGGDPKKQTSWSKV